MNINKNVENNVNDKVKWFSPDLLKLHISVGSRAITIRAPTWFR